MTEHAVVIAGGGPTGMMLGAELALADVDVAIVERRTGRELESSRAGGLLSRTIEVLDQRGVADRFISEGEVHEAWGDFAGVQMAISDFPTRHNYVLGLWQSHIERILGGWVDELPVAIYRGREVTGFTQDDTNVDLELSDGESLRAEYLVGCDGGRSLIRKAAGIEFPGWDPSNSSLIAEVEMDGEPEFGVQRDDKGVHAIGPAEDGRVRVVLREEHLGQTAEPTLRDVRELLVTIRGTDYGLRSAAWISRFTDMTRQAATYRNRRVLLAGDAAHIHSPMGGQGLGTGVQDAVNLGWKLAQVVEQTSPETLLDTYHAERHPVGARTLQTTMALIALSRVDERIEALRHVLADVLAVEAARERIAGRLSGLDIHYDLGAGHPLLGRRMPDLDLVAAGGPVRVFALLHDARPVLLNLGEPGSLDAAPRDGSRQAGRRRVRGRVGAPGAWRGQRSHGGPDPPRRLRGLGGRRDRPRARRRDDNLVRSARWLTVCASASPTTSAGPSR
jgi:2-polyprenyl-6-methoxyphenol hydroxylase-like FAD-dependent oxidoreductase